MFIVLFVFIHFFYHYCVDTITFFFYCYAAHRDLHSFPTRRSSDLETWESPEAVGTAPERGCKQWSADRKSTRLNSSHVAISYAVFCLKKKKSYQDGYYNNNKIMFIQLFIYESDRYARFLCGIV